MPLTDTEFNRMLDIVQRAGSQLYPHFGKVEKVKNKSDNPADIVTKLDEQIEKLLEHELKKIDKTIGFKGEEFGDRINSDRFWLADPIDGTGYFVRGVPGCTVMLALIEEGKITASAIYDFVAGEMFCVKKGRGSFMNKKRIHVSNKSLKDAIIYFETDLRSKKNVSTYLSLDAVCLTLSGYPSGIHFTQVASGKAEGRIHQDGFGKEWDFAPGQLLVLEAGGSVANLGTDSFDYKILDHMSVNKAVYDELTKGLGAIFPVKNV